LSTIVIYTSPARGHLYPMMDVALALHASGHRVVVQTLADERERIEQHGLEFRPIAGAIEALELQDYKGGNPVAQFKAAMDCWLARAPHEVDDLRATVAAVVPDLLIVDANSWGAQAFAESQGPKWAMFMPYCYPVPDPAVPAFGPGFAPPRGPLGRFRDRLVWSVVNRVTNSAVIALDALRQRLGVSPVATYADLYGRADVTLYRTAEPFDYPRLHWPDGTAAIGPGLWAPPATVPEWVRDLPRPRVLVSVSTELQNDGAIIQAALDALADEPVSVIVTTSALDPATFRAPNDRTRIVKFLSHAAVLPEIDLVVTHGGMGTVQRALAAGVPMVVVPWGRDQNESARRVVLCGAGTMVPRGRLKASRLRDAARKAMGCRAGAERVARAFADAGGAPRAVELIEALVRG
jgi:MGT family glycosyltransferase